MKIVDKIATRTNEDKTERKVPYKTIELEEKDRMLDVPFGEVVKSIADQLGVTGEDVISGWNGGLALRMNAIANKPWAEVSENKARTELGKLVVQLLAAGKTKDAMALVKEMESDPVGVYKARFQK